MDPSIPYNSQSGISEGGSSGDGLIYIQLPSGAYEIYDPNNVMQREEEEEVVYYIVDAETNNLTGDLLDNFTLPSSSTSVADNYYIANDVNNQSSSFVVADNNYYVGNDVNNQSSSFVVADNNYYVGNDVVEPVNNQQEGQEVNFLNDHSPSTSQSQGQRAMEVQVVRIDTTDNLQEGDQLITLGPPTGSELVMEGEDEEEEEEQEQEQEGNEEETPSSIDMSSSSDDDNGNEDELTSTAGIDNEMMMIHHDSDNHDNNQEEEMKNSTHDLEQSVLEAPPPPQESSTLSLDSIITENLTNNVIIADDNHKINDNHPNKLNPDPDSELSTPPNSSNSMMITDQTRAVTVTTNDTSTSNGVIIKMEVKKAEIEEGSAKEIHTRGGNTVMEEIYDLAAAPSKSEPPAINHGSTPRVRKQKFNTTNIDTPVRHSSRVQLKTQTKIKEEEESINKSPSVAVAAEVPANKLKKLTSSTKKTPQTKSIVEVSKSNTNSAPTSTSAECPICHTPFQLASSIRKHLARFHGAKLAPSKPPVEFKSKSAQCNLCGVIIIHPCNLTKHLKRKHNLKVTVSKPARSYATNIFHTTSDGTVIFEASCYHCNERFNQETDYRTHTHHTTYVNNGKIYIKTEESRLNASSADPHPDQGNSQMVQPSTSSSQPLPNKSKTKQKKKKATKKSIKTAAMAKKAITSTSHPTVLEEPIEDSINNNNNSTSLIFPVSLAAPADITTTPASSESEFMETETDASQTSTVEVATNNNNSVPNTTTTTTADASTSASSTDHNHFFSQKADSSKATAVPIVEEQGPKLTKPRKRKIKVSKLRKVAQNKQVKVKASKRKKASNNKSNKKLKKMKPPAALNKNLKKKNNKKKLKLVTTTKSRHVKPGRFRPAECKICKRFYYDPSSLKKHQVKQHPELNLSFRGQTTQPVVFASSKAKPVECAVCKKMYYDKHSLKNHQNRVHGNIDLINDLSSTNITETEMLTQPGPSSSTSKNPLSSASSSTNTDNNSTCLTFPINLLVPDMMTIESECMETQTQSTTTSLDSTNNSNDDDDDNLVPNTTTTSSSSTDQNQQNDDDNHNTKDAAPDLVVKPKPNGKGKKAKINVSRLRSRLQNNKRQIKAGSKSKKKNNNKSIKATKKGLKLALAAAKPRISKPEPGVFGPNAKPVECEICKKVLYDSRNLKRHKQFVHKNINTKLASSSSSKKSPRSASSIPSVSSPSNVNNDTSLLPPPLEVIENQTLCIIDSTNNNNNTNNDEVQHSSSTLVPAESSNKINSKKKNIKKRRKKPKLTLSKKKRIIKAGGGLPLVEPSTPSCSTNSTALPKPRHLLSPDIIPTISSVSELMESLPKSSRLDSSTNDKDIIVASTTATATTNNTLPITANHKELLNGNNNNSETDEAPPKVLKPRKINVPPRLGKVQRQQVVVKSKNNIKNLKVNQGNIKKGKKKAKPRLIIKPKEKKALNGPLIKKLVHVVGVGAKGSKGGAKCEICHKVVSVSYYLKHHYRRVHPEINKFDGERLILKSKKIGKRVILQNSKKIIDKRSGPRFTPVRCEICQKRIFNKYYLKVHMKRQHGNIMIDNTMKPSSSKAENTDTDTSQPLTSLSASTSKEIPKQRLLPIPSRKSNKSKSATSLSSSFNKAGQNLPSTSSSSNGNKKRSRSLPPPVLTPEFVETQTLPIDSTINNTSSITPHNDLLLDQDEEQQPPKLFKQPKINIPRVLAKQIIKPKPKNAIRKLRLDQTNNRKKMEERLANSKAKKKNEKLKLITKPKNTLQNGSTLKRRPCPRPASKLSLKAAQCKICKTWYFDCHTLKRHHDRFHPGIKFVDKNHKSRLRDRRVFGPKARPVECAICKRMMFDRHTLMRHQKFVHRVHGNIKPDTNTIKASETDSTQVLSSKKPSSLLPSSSSKKSKNISSLGSPAVKKTRKKSLPSLSNNIQEEILDPESTPRQNPPQGQSVPQTPLQVQKTQNSGETENCCDICHKSYSNLARHQYFVHNTGPASSPASSWYAKFESIPCQYCHMTLRGRSVAERHMRNFHKNNNKKESKKSSKTTELKKAQNGHQKVVGSDLSLKRKSKQLNPKPKPKPTFSTKKSKLKKIKVEKSDVDLAQVVKENESTSILQVDGSSDESQLEMMMEVEEIEEKVGGIDKIVNNNKSTNSTNNKLKVEEPQQDSNCLLILNKIDDDDDVNINNSIITTATKPETKVTNNNMTMTNNDDTDVQNTNNTKPATAVDHQDQQQQQFAEGYKLRHRNDSLKYFQKKKKVSVQKKDKKELNNDAKMSRFKRSFGKKRLSKRLRKNQRRQSMMKMRMNKKIKIEAQYQQKEVDENCQNNNNNNNNNQDSMLEQNHQEKENPLAAANKEEEAEEVEEEGLPSTVTDDETISVYYKELVYVKLPIASFKNYRSFIDDENDDDNETRDEENEVDDDDEAKIESESEELLKATAAAAVGSGATKRRRSIRTFAKKIKMEKSLMEKNVNLELVTGLNELLIQDTTNGQEMESTTADSPAVPSASAELTTQEETTTDDDDDDDEEDETDSKPRAFVSNCPICDEPSIPVSQLESHIFSHQMICHICHRDDLTINTEYAAHGVTHIKSTTCEICDYKAYSKINLWEHGNSTHFGVEPFICKYCGATFASKGQMVIHQKVKHL